MRSLLVALLVILSPLPVLADRPVPERHGQEEVEDIPPILYSAIWSPAPTFISADVAIEPDGKLNTDVLDDVSVVGLSTLLDNFKRGALDRDDCVPYGPVYVDRVNPPDRSSITAAARTSRLILEGTVAGRDYGFYRGHVPGQLLKVETRQVIKGDRLLDWYYVFYPVGRFKAGPYTFCKTDPRLPAPPELGQQVLLLIPEVADPGEPVLDLRDENSIIVLDEKGEAHLPESFSRTEAGRLTREQVLSEIRTVVREP